MLLSSLFILSFPYGVLSAAIQKRDISCPSADGTTFTASNGQQFVIECGVDRYGGDLAAPNGQAAGSLDQCITQCVDRSGCVSVQWLDNNGCYLKGTVNSPSTKSDVWGAIPVTAAQAKAVQPAAASVAVTPAATPASTGTSGTKRGLAYNDPGLTSFFGSKLTWSYNWGQTAGSGLRSGLEYVPMLHDAGSVGTWKANAAAAIASGAKNLLSFNEPDLSSQANIDYGTAASLYKTYMQPFAGQARLSSPAVTNGGSPLGLTWLQNFFDACSGCTIDFVPVHWYGSAGAGDDFKQHVQQACQLAGSRPVWVTEFGLTTGSAADAVSFLQDVVPWLDSTPCVERYAFFFDAPSTNGGNFLINAASSALSTIGDVYNSL